MAAAVDRYGTVRTVIHRVPVSRTVLMSVNMMKSTIVAHVADNIRQKTLPVTPPLGDSGNGCLAQPRVIQFSRTRGFQPRATAE
jgi:hypothetical protein